MLVLTSVHELGFSSCEWRASPSRGLRSLLTIFAWASMRFVLYTVGICLYKTVAAMQHPTNMQCTIFRCAQSIISIYGFTTCFYKTLPTCMSHCVQLCSSFVPWPLPMFREKSGMAWEIKSCDVWTRFSILPSSILQCFLWAGLSLCLVICHKERAFLIKACRSYYL